MKMHRGEGNTKLIGGSALVLLYVSLLLNNNHVTWQLTYMLCATLSIVAGSVCGILSIVYLINAAANDDVMLRSSENLDRPKFKPSTGLWSKLSLSLRWSLTYVKSKLIKSKLLKSMRKPVKGVNDGDVYEIVQQLGRTNHLKNSYGGNKYSKDVGMSKQLTELLDRLFDYTYRDYVEVWYAQVSFDRGNFHKLLFDDYWKIVSSLAKRLQEVDFLDLIMCKYTRVVTRYFTDLRTTAELPGAKEEAPKFVLHPALRSSRAEQEYLRLVSDYVINLSLPERVLQVSSARFILREILSGLVLQRSVELMSEPDYINRTALAHLRHATHHHHHQHHHQRNYSLAATYEDFIRIINKCDDLPTLHQIRLKICTEITQATTISALKKDGSKAGKAKSMDKGELLMTRNLKRYINQCQVAKQQCERKMRSLGGEGGDGALARSQQEAEEGSRSQLLTYEEVMGSPVARSYLLKYLRKVGRSHLLKFWEQIEFVRSSKVSGKELAKIVSYSYQTYIGSSASAPTGEEGSNLLKCVQVDKATLIGMRECLIGNKPPDDFFTVQKQVYEKVRSDHYPSFVVSEVYTDELTPHLLDISIHTADDQADDAGQAEPVFAANSNNNNKDDGLPTAFGDEGTAASGAMTSSRSSTTSSCDRFIQQISAIDEKLEYKAQALASLKPTAGNKNQPKMMKRLVREIHVLQKEKWKLQLGAERSDTWWENIGNWGVHIATGYHNSSQGSSGAASNFHYCVTLRLLRDTAAPSSGSNNNSNNEEDRDEVTGWSVVRTLKDFHQLHDGLKQYSEWVKEVQLPKPPLFRLLSNQQKFLSESRQDLDVFLLKVMKDATLRCSQTVFAFLSPDDHNAHPNNSNDGVEAPMKPLVSASDFFSRFPADVFLKSASSNASVVTSSSSCDERVGDGFSSDSNDDDDDAGGSKDSVASQAYVLIGEVFELTGLFRFLRHTLIVFVRVAFGRSIDRQLRETCRWLTSQPMLASYAASFLRTMWPQDTAAGGGGSDGANSDEPSERTQEEKDQTREEFKEKLLESIPETVNATIGHENARRGFLKLFYALQDKQLNKHLIFNLLGETMESVFPEIVVPSSEGNNNNKASSSSTATTVS